MATEAEIVDAKIKLKEANDVVSSIVDRYVRNSMAGIAGEKNEYVLSDMLLRGKIDVSDIGNELGAAQQGTNDAISDHNAEQQNGIQAESDVRFNEFGEIVRDGNTTENTRNVVDAEAGQEVPIFTPPVIDNEEPTFTPQVMGDKKPAVTPTEKQVESGMATSEGAELENALTSVFDKDKAKASQDDLNAGGVVNGAQDEDFMAQIRAMQNQMNAEKEGAATVETATDTPMEQANPSASVQPENGVRFNEFGEIVRDGNTGENMHNVGGGEANRDIPTFEPPVINDEMSMGVGEEIPTFTPPENLAENGAGNGGENIAENVNRLGADDVKGEKVDDSKVAEVDNTKEFRPIDFSFEDENEVAAEVDNQKQAELSAEAASGRVDNLSDDALERLKASLKVAGEEERER